MTAVVVIAKACLPGRVKTRLTPPFSPEQAARLAAASLDDTLATVAALPVGRRVLFFDGFGIADAPASAAGFEVVPQPAGSLDERLAHVFDLLDEPTLLVGMDTPQVGAAHVAAALDGFAGGEALADLPPAPCPDAWFGPAADGGFWALALRRPRGDVLRGVPMSRADTGAQQLRRLRDAGLRVALLPTLTDVDTAAEARQVAAGVPGSRFAAELARIAAELGRAA
ncbi:hypothetical protein BJ978_000816 [Agromyces terreus]|uniref:DUF2064 domain-containing protein n=1 Tax=Agromyces terreus TaxID=424795 RepID=A0A9X2GW42_9MICO|nr:TIGR04282 family arsenosugar biosynthesis glycosyltransferase [Agromyces terreus]MCP2370140.1 hypothetical protein [Agromyces terreus]